MEGKRSHKRLRIILIIVGTVIAVLVIAMAVYFGTYYHSVDVEKYFTDSDTVTVTETDSGWLFDGDGVDTALIFYPGAKVEASAYAPLLYELAEEGMGRVRITISDEGMTIANPGGFVEGVSIDNLLTAEPHGRNPLLADSLKRIGLAERTGRGIDRIFEGSLRYGKPLPDYSASTSVTVSVIIPKSKPDFKLTKLIIDEQNRLGRSLSVNALFVLNTLKDSPKSTISQLADIVHFSESTIKGILVSAK